MVYNLAGRLPLQEMIAQHIDTARVKLAAADNKERERDQARSPRQVEAAEPDAAVAGAPVDPHDPEQIEKLASALEFLSEKLADSTYNGGESHQGGEQLPVQRPMPGKQSYTGKHARHQLPMHTGTKATKDNPGAGNAMDTDEARAPGGNGAKYPAKGVFKTAGQSVLDRIEAKKALVAGVPPEVVEAQQEKKSAADFILGKLAEYEGGGLVLTDDKSGNNPKPPSNAGRQLIASNAAPVAATKRQAKEPRKRELKEVLTEPALSSATDDTVQRNLRNASKGGVKIAAARAYLQKIAEEGCVCGDKGTCRHCKLKAATEARKASK